MAIFASFVISFTVLRTFYIHVRTTAFMWYDCQWPWAYFKVIGLFHIKFVKNAVWYGKSYYRLLIGNHTLAFDWCHFWWPWSTMEGHFSLGCHFHVHFSNHWYAFASHGLPCNSWASCQISMALSEHHTNEAGRQIIAFDSSKETLTSTVPLWYGTVSEKFRLLQWYSRMSRRQWWTSRLS